MVKSKLSANRWREILAVTLSLLCATPSIATAEERNREFSAGFTVVFKGVQFSGTKICRERVKCSLLYRKDPLLSLSVTKEVRNSYELDIDCYDCSFSSGKPFLYIAQEREFAIYYGRDYGITRSLVFNRREQLGTVSLTFPDDDKHSRQRPKQKAP